MLFPGIVADGLVLPAALTKVTPKYLDSATSASSTSSTTANVTLPATRNTDDLLLMFLTVHGSSLPWPLPSGWGYYAYQYGVNSSTTDLGGALLYRKVDGSESSPTAVTLANSSTWSAVVIRIKAGTYTINRGGSKTTFDYYSVYNNFSSPHLPIGPNWGGEHALWMSFYSRKVSISDAPTPQPFSTFNVRPSYINSTVPESSVSGGEYDSPLTSPHTPTTYSRSSYDSTAAMTVVLRGAWTPDRPLMYIAQSVGNATAQTTFSLSALSGLLAPVSGDLNLVLIMMYGASGVTITPPAGYTLVKKYGSRLALYKRVFDGTESFPQTWTFSSATKYMAKSYYVEKDTFDTTSSIVTAESTFSSSSSVSTPSISAQSGWGALNNLAMYVVVRDGVGGAPGYSVNSWPSAAPENRSEGYTSGSSGSDVSHAICGAMISADSVGSVTIGYSGVSPGEAMTIFIKGI